MPVRADGRLAEIVLKACAYRREDRYFSPETMRKELEAILYEADEARVIYPNGDKVSEADGLSTNGTVALRDVRRRMELSQKRDDSEEEQVTWVEDETSNYIDTAQEEREEATENSENDYYGDATITRCGKGGQQTEDTSEQEKAVIQEEDASEEQESVEVIEQEAIETNEINTENTISEDKKKSKSWILI